MSYKMLFLLKVWEINLELILTTKILKINDLLIANLLMHINIKYSNVPLRSLKSKLPWPNLCSLIAYLGLLDILNTESY